MTDRDQIVKLLVRAIVKTIWKPGRKPEDRVELDRKLYNQALALLRKPTCETCGDKKEVPIRNQPCGCVFCVCEDKVQCHGCGEKMCGYCWDDMDVCKTCDKRCCIKCLKNGICVECRENQ